MTFSITKYFSNQNRLCIYNAALYKEIIMKLTAVFFLVFLFFAQYGLFADYKIKRSDYQARVCSDDYESEDSHDINEEPKDSNDQSDDSNYNTDNSQEIPGNNFNE